MKNIWNCRFFSANFAPQNKKRLVMNTRMYSQMPMCCCCCNGMHTMNSKTEIVVHIINNNERERHEKNNIHNRIVFGAVS